MDSEIPPFWHREGDPRFLLGTDAQGRDILSAVIYGARISLGVGFASVVLALVLGVGLDRKSTRLNSVTNAHLVCRLLLEKKKTSQHSTSSITRITTT